MAGRIRPEDVEAVRERTDIVKVVSSYLQLKKAGRDSMIGLCPFHTEKTPSLSVSPEKQLFYCFGCQEGGNVFRFLERLENLSFAETVEKLAREAGITLRYEGESTADRRQHGRRQVIHRAIAEAAGLYHRMLLEGREATDARDYLAGRGISHQSIERFGVGYAPGYPDFLLKRMSKTFSVDLLVEAGLASRDPSGTLRDRFRGRVVFPIHDLSGNAVGFGGRLLAGSTAPPGTAAKYVNSPESPVYHKGSLLYNLNRAKAEVTRSGRAWLVEGYTDVIALDQAGVPEVVATCGTALGEEHIRLLSRFTDRLVLSFDSDEAGARAADRAYEFHQRYPVDLLVLVLPEGQDPADFSLAQGGGDAAGQAFRALEERARPLVEYMIDRALRRWDLTDVEQQARAVGAGVDIVLGLEDPARRDKYAALLADKAGVGVDAVLLKIDQALRGHRAGEAPGQARQGPRLPPHQRLEREVLKLMVQEPALCLGRSVDLRPEHFSRAEHRRVLQLLGEIGGRQPEATAARTVAAGQDAGADMGRLLSELAMEGLETLHASPEYAERLFLRLEEFLLKAKADEIRKRLQRMNPLKAEDYEALYVEFVALEGTRRRVRSAQESIETPS
jgi:DNA primase